MNNSLLWLLKVNPNLGGGGLLPPCAKFGISNIPQSPDILLKSGSSISDFQISGQFLMKKKVITPEPVMILK